MSFEKHIEYLREKILFTDTRWPFYDLLLSDLQDLADKFKGKRILSMERNILYGGQSIFLPLFQNSETYVMEMSPPKNAERGAYNDVEDERRMVVPSNTPTDPVDLIIVPNVLHHVGDMNQFLSTVKQFSQEGTKLYIFEPLHRELHQTPEDYWRFTPYGLVGILAGHGFELEDEKEIGDATDVIAYFIDQLLQYAPEGEEQLRPFLNHLLTVRVVGNNKVRENTRCPMAFSVLGRYT